MILRIIYTLFIGVLLATFVGVGIAAFYTGPVAPEQPAVLKYIPTEELKDTKQFKVIESQLNKFDNEMRIYEMKLKIYSRNVSIISLLASILLVIVSLTFLKRIFLLSDGILLGGVLTLLYSIIRGFGSDDTRFRFVVVAIGLVVSLVLGYLKFIISIDEVKNT